MDQLRSLASADQPLQPLLATAAIIESKMSLPALSPSCLLAPAAGALSAPGQFSPLREQASSVVIPLCREEALCLGKYQTLMGRASMQT